MSIYEKIRLGSLYNWLRENKLFSNQILDDNFTKKRKRNKISKSNVKWTHYILSGVNGGCLYVPDDLYSTFLQKLAADIKENGPNIMGISEQRSNIFKFHLDMDYKLKDESELRNIKSHIQTIQNILKKFFIKKTTDGKFKYSVIVFSRQADYGESISYGVHIVFPKIRVNQHMALQIRQAIIKKMYDEFGNFGIYEDEAHNGWDFIIDENIFKSNGLRMPYCKNVKNCTCRSLRYSQSDDSLESWEYCSNCSGERKYIVDNHYEIDYVLNSDSTVNKEETLKLKKNILHCLILGSIRTLDDISENWNTDYANKYPINHIDEKLSKVKYKNYDIWIKKNSENIIEYSGQVYWKLILEKIKNYSYNGNYPYKNLYISRITKNTNKKEGIVYSMYTSGQGSRWCMNNNGDHNSAFIYFNITKIFDTIYINQRCTCKCPETGNKFMRCLYYNNLMYSFYCNTINKIFLFHE